MGILKYSGVIGLIVTLGCTNTITKVIQLETDTYITTENTSDHSEEATIKISVNGSAEERALVKLPTGKNDRDENLSDLFENLFFVVFYMPLFILVDLLTTCEEAILQPENLTSATLNLDVASDNGNLETTLRMYLLSKPWWHTASWTTAHPFSSSGRWTSEGGDVDSTFTALSPSVSSGVMSFDVTDYFKTLISNTNTAHYGFVLKGEAGSSGDLALHSVQATSGTAPRVVATYTGSCLTSSSIVPEEMSTRKTTYLTNPPVSVVEYLE